MSNKDRASEDPQKDREDDRGSRENVSLHDAKSKGSDSRTAPDSARTGRPIIGEEKLMNKNRNRVNQPPTGEGKKQSPRSGAANKLHKRSEVLQAGRAEQNIGSAEDEAALRSEGRKTKRAKAGR